MAKTAQELLAQLTACPVGFDANADHKYGVTIVPKVATVPTELFRDLQEYLQNAS